MTTVPTERVLLAQVAAVPGQTLGSSCPRRFQVLTAANMRITALWDIAPYNVLEVDRRFRGQYCLHHQILEAVIFKQ
jgi:hypothetical protein